MGVRWRLEAKADVLRLPHLCWWRPNGGGVRVSLAQEGWILSQRLLEVSALVLRLGCVLYRPRVPRGRRASLVAGKLAGLVLGPRCACWWLDGEIAGGRAGRGEGRRVGGEPWLRAPGPEQPGLALEGPRTVLVLLAMGHSSARV